MNAEWQPIATAPRDGTAVLVWDGDDRCVGAWVDRIGYAGNWYAVIAGIISIQPLYDVWETPWGLSPTHWMPLPPPPSTP